MTKTIIPFSIKQFCAILITIIVLGTFAGCASRSRVLSTESAKTLIGQDAALISTPASGQGYIEALISEVDGESLTAWHVKVKPGWHSITLFQPDFRSFRKYTINTRPGKRYDLTGLGNGWEMSRNPEDDSKYIGGNQASIYSSRPIFSDSSGTFVDSETYNKEKNKVMEESNQKQAALYTEQFNRERARITEKQQNLPLVRKIGARICHPQGGFIYVGYVETLAEEKVQIRISEAYFQNNRNIHPGGFSPSIIWDYPMNWDLCE